MDLMYGISVFDRGRGNFPNLPVVNMFAEETETENSVALISRPGLEEAGVSMGSSPVRQLFQADGVLNRQLFGVAGNSLYASDNLLGTIDGDGYVSMAGYEDYVFVCAGNSLWGYDGTTFAEVTFPDNANVSKVVTGASRLIVLRKDTQTFYWSDPLTTTIDALSFATAENSPDRLLDMLFLGDRLVLFGAETVEFWPLSDDDDLPFQPLVGYTFQVGIRDVGCAAKLAGTFAWINERNQICLSKPENIISTPSIETKLEQSETAVLWVFELEGVEFLAVRSDTETSVYSTRSGQWSVFSSYGYDNWLPQCFDGGVFGSYTNGSLLQWSDDHTDLGGVLERRFRGWLALDSGPFVAANIILRTNPGQTPYLEGTYTDPSVELRTSRDGGFEWGSWRTRSLGEQGKYRTTTVWRSLGMFSYPGLLVDVRMTDPVPFRVSGLKVNEAYGGV
jgi:hypothetical protein